MMTDDNGWRNLCRMVSDEQDPHRLSELVDELVRVLDARKQKLDGGPSTPGAGEVTKALDSRRE